MRHVREMATIARRQVRDHYSARHEPSSVGVPESWAGMSRAARGKADRQTGGSSSHWTIEETCPSGPTTRVSRMACPVESIKIV